MQNYDDIIHLSRPESAAHPPMPRAARAAQFSPFAALTGYDAAVAETARLTDSRIELTEDKKQLLDERLHLLLDMADHPPAVRITRFIPDERKAGGSYETVTCKIASVDTFEGCVVLTDKRRIPIADISEIEL